MRVAIPGLLLISVVSGCATEQAFNYPPATSILTGALPPEAAPAINYYGTLYRRLEGVHLRRSIVGVTMSSDPHDEVRIISSGGFHVSFFGNDGVTYLTHVNNREVERGSYTVLQNRICIQTPRQRACFALLRSEEGALLQNFLAPRYSPRRIVLTR